MAHAFKGIVKPKLAHMVASTQTVGQEGSLIKTVWIVQYRAECVWAMLFNLQSNDNLAITPDVVIPVIGRPMLRNLPFRFLVICKRGCKLRIFNENFVSLPYFIYILKCSHCTLLLVVFCLCTHWLKTTPWLWTHLTWPLHVYLKQW